MKQKLSSVVTVRLPNDLMFVIENLAKAKDWTISHTVYRLIQLGLLGSLAGISAQEVSGNED